MTIQSVSFFNPYNKRPITSFPAANKTDNDSVYTFVAKKDYAGALDHINRYSSEKDYSELKRYINNPAFDSLASSKYYNYTFGFRKLADTIYALHKTQQDAFKTVTTPGYFCPYLPDEKKLYAGISVDKCITNLDNFFKSGFSEDLKLFVKNGTDKLSDLWFVAHNLKKNDINSLLADYTIM